MSPHAGRTLKSWGPGVLGALLTAAIAILGAWVLLTSRVSALEIKADERKGDIQELKQDVREVRDLLLEHMGRGKQAREGR